MKNLLITISLAIAFASVLITVVNKMDEKNYMPKGTVTPNITSYKARENPWAYIIDENSGVVYIEHWGPGGIGIAPAYTANGELMKKEDLLKIMENN